MTTSSLSLVARRPSTESSASGWSTSLPRYPPQRERDVSVGLRVLMTLLVVLCAHRTRLMCHRRIARWSCSTCTGAPTACSPRPRTAASPPNFPNWPASKSSVPSLGKAASVESSLTPIPPAHGQRSTIGWRPSTRSLRDWTTPLRSTLGSSIRKAGYLSLSFHHLPPIAAHTRPAARNALQGYRPQNVVIGGDSAGGGLTLATMLRCAAPLASTPVEPLRTAQTNLHFLSYQSEGPRPAAALGHRLPVSLGTHHHTTPHHTRQ